MLLFAGDYRRQVSEAQHPKHSFFDVNNSQAKAIREACMEVAIWLKCNQNVFGRIQDGVPLK
jgi:hypothetical protein